MFSQCAAPQAAQPLYTWWWIVTNTLPASYQWIKKGLSEKNFYHGGTRSF